MTIDRSAFSDKVSHDPKILALYEREAEYLRAYAQHTDMRVQDDPQMAIGGMWEEHGKWQRAFLIGNGLRPTHRLLDIGCGTGRFARQIVPYLEPDHYTGIDISEQALTYAGQLAQDEGWITHRPTFLRSDGTLTCVAGQHFDFIWAYSVFTHLPPARIVAIFHSLAQLSFTDFYFTYRLRKEGVAERTGLKQFRYHQSFFAELATQHGFAIEWIGKRPWAPPQHTGHIYHAS